MAISSPERPDTRAPCRRPTTTPPTPLVGAAAVVLSTLQPTNTLPVIGGSSGGGGGGGGGGGTIGTGGVAGAILPGLFTPTTFIPPFGSSFVPTVTNLSALNYAPIPLSVALKQYQVPQGFFQRQYALQPSGGQASRSARGHGNQNRSRNNNSGSGLWTLGRKVFTRGRFHPGKSLQWTHSLKVINGTTSEAIRAGAESHPALHRRGQHAGVIRSVEVERPRHEHNVAAFGEGQASSPIALRQPSPPLQGGEIMSSLPREV